MKFDHPKILLIIMMVFLNHVTRVIASENIVNQSSNLLTSRQLVSAVLIVNPKLEIAQAVWETASARINQQATFEDPVFSYYMAPQTVDNSHTEYGQRIEISQKLPWHAKLHLHAEVASFKADASSQTINSLRINLATTAKSLFADWYYIHQAIAINQHNQTLLKEFRSIAISRYSTGLTSKQDALQAEMELALIEHKSIILNRKQRSIRTHINTLLNKLPNSTLPQPSELAEINVLPDIKLLHNLSLQTRPELKALIATIDAAKSQSKLVLKNNYPDISLKAGYNSLWENSSKHFTVGIGFNLPLFQTKQRAAENEAHAQIKQAEWQQIDFIAKLREEIQISYDMTNESIHVLSLYRNKLLPLAKETLDAAKSDYQSGKGDFLSMISSEKIYMQTQLQTEQALANIHRHLAKLERAVGSLEPLSSTQVSVTQ